MSSDYFIQLQLYDCSLCKASQIKCLFTLPGNFRKYFKITKQITFCSVPFYLGEERQYYSFPCERWESELRMQPRRRIMLGAVSLSFQ